MSSTAFQLLSPLSLCSSRSNLRQSCEIELLSTSRQTKQLSTLLPTEGKTSTVTAATNRCQSLISSVTVGKKRNLGA